MFKRKRKEPMVKEILVLKDLKPTDTVFFKLTSPFNLKEAIQLREKIMEILKCNVIFVPVEVDVISVIDKRV